MDDSMASLPRSSSTGSRLFELLEEQQEPFLLDVYLLENGCSKKVLNSEAATLCWPGNSCKRLQSMINGGFRRRRGGILRSMAALFLDGVRIGKVSNWGKKALESRRFSVSSCISDMRTRSFVSESDRLSSCSSTDVGELCKLEGDAERNHKWECRVDSKQLSPVSVLDLHSDNSSPVYEHRAVKEENLLSLPTGPSNNFEELLESASLEWSHQSESTGKSQGGQIFTWRMQAGDLVNTTHMIESDFSGSKEEWSRLQDQVREVVETGIADSIFEDIREDVVSDMLAFLNTC